MTDGDKVRQLVHNLPQGTVQSIDDMNLRMFGFVMIDVVGAVLEGMAIVVDKLDAR